MEKEHELPIDQHQLLALVAPRPLLVTSASKDLWADPEGEWASCCWAAPAYGGGLPAPGGPSPDLGKRVGSTLAYSRRAGGHDITALEWHHAVDHMSDHLMKRSL